LHVSQILTLKGTFLEAQQKVPAASASSQLQLISFVSMARYAVKAKPAELFRIIFLANLPFSFAR
jgi:hypothetical protein